MATDEKKGFSENFYRVSEKPNLEKKIEDGDDKVREAKDAFQKCLDYSHDNRRAFCRGSNCC